MAELCSVLEKSVKRVEKADWIAARLVVPSFTWPRAIGHSPVSPWSDCRLVRVSQSLKQSDSSHMFIKLGLVMGVSRIFLHT